MNKSSEYLDLLRERGKTSRIYTRHQGIGLTLSEILHDKEHKSLYMKLAKEYDNELLIRLARDVGERKNVKNKGAYFMTLLKKLKKK